MKLSDFSDEELMSEAQSLHSLINNAECFGTKDLTKYEMILRLLEKRGYDVTQKSILLFEEMGG